MTDDVNSYLVYGEKGWQCAVCGFTGMKGNIKQHIEARHMENTNVSCEICGRAYKTKNSLQNHMALKHRPNKF